MEMQVRQQPFAGSRTVSLVTAVAMNVAGDVVGVYAGGKDPLFINHKRASIGEQAIPLRHGGMIQPQGNGLVVMWPGKSQVQILYGNYLDYIVTVCPNQPFPMEGLLGRDDDPNAAAVTSRNGATVQLASLNDPKSTRELYRVWGDSWRISRRESLFDYPAGTNTETFTDRNFPYEDAPAVLPPDKSQKAEAICRKAGITDGAALAECIYDVSVTGDEGFADNDALLESLHLKMRKAQTGQGNFDCSGPGGQAGWTCQVHQLTGAEVGSSMTLVLETLQSGQKATENLTCGPITDTFDANCSGQTTGMIFQGSQIIERYTLKSGERWEVKSLGTCRPVKAPGGPC
jgi:hypothetical protein